MKLLAAFFIAPLILIPLLLLSTSGVDVTSPAEAAMEDDEPPLELAAVTTTSTTTTTTIDFEALEEYLDAVATTTTTTTNPPPPPTAAPVLPAQTGTPTAHQWEVLRQCESGGDYTITNPSGKYRGAYQFGQQTWDSVAPHLAGVDPATASPADQDAAALALWHSRGWQPWPRCGQKASAVR